ncbi:hypothetical protein HK405_008085, partial [Cladochytrium tenue]
MKPVLASALQPWPDYAYNLPPQDIPKFTQKPTTLRRKRREGDFEQVSVPELRSPVRVPPTMVRFVQQPIDLGRSGFLSPRVAARQVVDMFLSLLYRGLVDGASGRFFNTKTLPQRSTMKYQDLR